MAGKPITVDSLIRWASAGLVFFAFGAAGSLAMNFHNRISANAVFAARADEKSDYALREVAEAKQLLMIYTAISKLSDEVEASDIARVLKEVNADEE